MINNIVKSFKSFVDNDIEFKEVFSSIFGLVGVRIAALGISFLMSIIIARYLGISEYGAYSYAYSIATLLALGAVQGFDRQAMRETALAAPEKDWSTLRGVRNLAEYFALFTSILLGVISALWFYYSEGVSESPLLSTAAFAGLLTPFVALLRIEAGMLRGLKKVVLSQLPDQILRPVLLIGFILIMMLSDRKVTGVDIIILHSIAASIALVWSYLALRSVLPSEAKNARPNYQFRTHISSGFSMGGVAILGALLSQLPLLVIGSIGTAEETGSFAAALRLSQLVAFIYAATNMALGPSMARLYKTGNKSRMAKIGQTTAFIAVCLTLPVVIIFYFYSTEILSIYGEGFDQSSLALRILVVSQIFHVSMGSVALWLMMSKNEHYALAGTTLSLIVTILLCFILIPKFGTLGAAFATAGGMVTLNVSLAIVVVRLLGFNPTCYGFLWVQSKKLVSRFS